MISPVNDVERQSVDLSHLPNRHFGKDGFCLDDPLSVFLDVKPEPNQVSRQMFHAVDPTQEQIIDRDGFDCTFQHHWTPRLKPRNFIGGLAESLGQRPPHFGTTLRLPGNPDGRGPWHGVGFVSGQYGPHNNIEDIG